MERCTLCPRKCGVDRSVTTGFCGETQTIRIARAAPHYWEEPPISGTNGSGTIFFTGCNLRCCFCQNASIATSEIGQALSPAQLLHIMFSLKDQCVHNINLVTPSHYIPALIPILTQAKRQGLDLPIVWNSSGYETVASLQAMEGLVDIYLPDFKYIRSDTARKYANAPDYPAVAKAAIAEMVRQCGAPHIAPETGLMQRGVQVRHMILPGHAQESREILWYLHKTYGNSIGISIMSQYTPMPQMQHDPLLSRPLTAHEYDTVVRYAEQIGIEHAFIQDGSAVSESFIPAFSDHIL